MDNVSVSSLQNGVQNGLDGARAGVYALTVLLCLNSRIHEREGTEEHYSKKTLPGSGRNVRGEGFDT